MSSREWVYGLHAVQALLKRHPDRVLELKLAERRDDPRLRAIETLAREHGTRVQRVDAQTLLTALGDVAHQGVAAEVVPLAPWSEDDLVSALGAAVNPLLLALDGVQDPHNLGACLRTADACGALAVVVPKDRAANLSPVVRKVAAGAAESVPLVTVTNLVRTLKLLKEADLWVTGADADATVTAAEVDFTAGTVLVMGAEGAGLRHLTRQTCDHMVRLPQLGSVESLNVSVAAGMLLYEVVRQRSKK
ncbi:MAG TPA: 23S rRNA (guanosine(2251)-2'-O)-methyltransferase RlmB [Steroidobacteraceae bacterium]